MKNKYNNIKPSFIMVIIVLIATLSGCSAVNNMQKDYESQPIEKRDQITLVDKLNDLRLQLFDDKYHSRSIRNKPYIEYERWHPIHPMSPITEQKVKGDCMLQAYRKVRKRIAYLKNRLKHDKNKIRYRYESLNDPEFKAKHNKEEFAICMNENYFYYK